MPDTAQLRALSSCAKGRVGEYIAAAALEALGWRVMLSPTEWIDLVALKGHHTIRVQVKSALETAEAGRRGRYRFKNGGRKLICDPEHVDILALVALDKRSVRFTLPPQTRIISVAPEEFTPEAEPATWNDVCAALAGESRARKF